MNNGRDLPFEQMPELRVLQSPSIRLAPNQRVPFPERIQRLVDHPLFQRLRGVRQLGFVDRVYPDATHTRFAHSLGVYNQAVYYLHALWRDPTNEYFRNTMQVRELRALLVAALCHDLGQYPYSHILEDTERTSDGFLEGSIFNHENYTARILTDDALRRELTSRCPTGTPDFLDLISDLGAIDNHDVVAVLRGEGSAGLRPGAVSVLHSIIDGPLDADKMDYLIRDSHHAGVNFGASVDIHRLYESLTVRVHKDEDGSDHSVIAVTDKGRVPAEQILIARGHMFTEIYWHRTVRAHETSVATAIRRLRPFIEGFEEWFSNNVLLPGGTDEWFIETLYLALSEKRGLPIRLKATSSDVPVIESCRALLDSVRWGSGRQPYKRLIALSHREYPTLYEAMQHIRHVSVANGSPLLDQIGKNLTELIRRHYGERVDYLEVLFDIPPKRSPANDAWVVSTRAANQGDAERLSTLSSMWHEYGSNFHDESRRIRIYCTQETRNRIMDRLGGSETKLLKLLEEAVFTVAKLAIQLELELIT